MDQSGAAGQFVLSGSQNFHLIREITQSLAGRVALCRLFPFDQAELRSAKLLPDGPAELMLRGNYPALFSRGIPSNTFYANYLQTYVERDIAELIQVRDLKAFRNFVRLCADRVGNLINLNDLARDASISQPTARAWLTLLETSCVIFLQPPYFENFSKRLVKSPRLHFYDTGLASNLLGIHNVSQLEGYKAFGALFENMVVSELEKQNQHRFLHREYFFWRDSNGNRVDLLCTTAEGFDIFEKKATHTLNADLAKDLFRFENISQRPCKKTVITSSAERQARQNFEFETWQLPV